MKIFLIHSEHKPHTRYHWVCCFSACTQTGLVSADVITVLTVSSMYTVSATEQLSVCVFKLTIPACFMSLFACLAEADVLVAQNWRAPLPRVRITRWPLFLGSACQIHPWKMNFSKHCGDLQALLSKRTREKGRVFMWTGKAMGQCLIEVQLLPRISLTLVKWWKENITE